MDITNNTTTTTTTTTICSVKTTEAEAETTQTPIRIQPVKPISFSNGVLKRHNSLNHGFNGNTNNNHHHHPVVVIYKECLRNHAASLGGHAVDGCGEFMPSPSSNPTDPTSLKCAACGCHRNFHRREPEEPPLVVNHNPIPALEYQPHHRHHPPPPPPPPPPLPQQQHGGALDNLDDSPSPPPISSAYYPASAPHMLLALSSGPLIDTTTQLIHNPNASTSNPNSRKRFRTKFTQTQKEKMLEFAERVGWKIQKKDEEMINEFCRSIGVEKGVLKVWMHNNKNTFGKKVSDHGNANGSVGFGFVGRNMNNTVDTCMRNTTATNATGGMEFQLQHERSNENDHKDHNSVAAHVVTTNGNGVSSSS